MLSYFEIRSPKTLPPGWVGFSGEHLVDPLNESIFSPVHEISRIFGQVWAPKFTPNPRVRCGVNFSIDFLGSS